ncbi:NAD(P)-dependent dehydrogenase, short-chain alcohol dehydrogenase family [Pseudonocardia thermophila]|uniref:NAD(P)-dependent dehydrogenase, short-chain alcohol dehydrogenase family n=1 Tax=Pseudonocardia thermophila TaxID=1848 RepID=A0A1M6P5Q0_PSETH|nr:SDR family NAD(P)-dependent oxidoreductase [Pseudonocardia thermophila]SHK03230.1 NAD(P)-dependent dehydrogenase, short-chain alcohol dehydrogenase family [Pseudonocardia thermophila]
MQLAQSAVAVTGGASGLGRAAAERLAAAGARVTIVDLPSSRGAEVAAEIGACFVPADVTEADQLAAAFAEAAEHSPLRAVVHAAGRGARIRLVSKSGEPGDLTAFEEVVRLNVVGSYNALRLGPAEMVKHPAPEGEERGAVVLTASVAAYEGQIGQIAYSAAKAAVVGMTITAARDLASSAVRVCTIVPGIFDTPLVRTVLRPDIQEALESAVPYPKRMGRPAEYGALAQHILENPYLNGECIRLDGAIRMAPR